MTELAPAPDRTGFIETSEHKLYWELFGNGDHEVVCLPNGLTNGWRRTSACIPLSLLAMPLLAPDSSRLSVPHRARANSVRSKYFMSFGSK